MLYGSIVQTKLHVHDVGSGPAVLLLHGCPTTTRGFEPLVRHLSASRRVLVPDLPGYGASPPVSEPYDLDHVQEILERELANRGVDEVAVIGHSAGAYRAFALALSGRVRVTHVVSLAGVAGFDPDVRAGFKELARVVREGVDLTSMWLGRMAGPGFSESHPADVGDVMAWLDAAPRSVVAAELEAFAEAADLRPRLFALTMPVLARVGDLDQAAPVACSQAIVDNVPGATLQIVAGRGHALFYEDSDATIEAVSRALDS
jgi:pimeloyl-ACP methyl ester carboxylesterase